jgi:serine/threonine protein kinase/Tol biopolymer transport system component
MTTDRWQRVSAIYHEALARSGEERSDYLRRACAGETLLLHEIESLLTADSESALLDAPALDTAARAMAEAHQFVGRRLGVYEVTAFLAAGGMGEVYKARDSRLDRTVAIKILPPDLAADPQFRERFDREARSISRLDHPNICRLYDVGEQDGTAFLVMQYLEGETLAQRLEKGKLPAGEAFECAIQIADALDKAHRANIVHRDLKPGNIMLTKNGAMLMDFGLAKAALQTSSAAGPPTSSTRSPAATLPGAILGTFAYMAPEQLEGREADARTDVFAFGVVVREMLTGQRPSAEQSHPLTPRSLDHIVGRCLAADPNKRWQTASDLALELKWVAKSSEARLAARERIVWAAIAVAALVAGAAFGRLYLRSTPASVSSSMRFTIAAPQRASFAFGFAGQPAVAISPDGRRLAFVALRDTTTILYVRSFDTFDAQPIDGTEDAAFPFWSPDGHSLGFITEARTLKTVACAGGAVRVLGRVTAGTILGGAWGAEGTIAIGSTAGGLLTTSVDGGRSLMPLTHVNAALGETGHGFPVFLPDGRHLLYWSQPSNIVWLASVDSQEARQLLVTDSQVRYLEPGYLLFGRQGSLMAQPFDWRRGALSGEPIRIADQVLKHPNGNRFYLFDASANGTLAYLSEPAPSTSTSQLTWFDRNGRRLNPIGVAAAYRNPTLSPDGKRVAVEITDAVTDTQDVWLIDSITGEPSRFTFDPANDIQPAWSPDGTRIMFGSDRSGVFNIYERPSSGGGSDELVLKSKAYMGPSSVIPDGSGVVYRTNLDGLMQVGVLPLVGARTPRLFDRKPTNYSQGRVSPDGRWLAYVSNESGRRSEVWVESFPEPGRGKWQVSRTGSSQVRWQRNGQLLYYSYDNKLMGVPIKSGSSLDIGAAVPLFEIPVVGGASSRVGYLAQWDVAPDGRFLVNVPTQDATPASINVLVNWQALLKK